MKKSALVVASVLVLGSAVGFCDIDEGLEARYPFDGGTEDTSGNDHHGVVYGAVPTTDRYGNQDSAYLFDDVTDVIMIPSGLGNIDNSSFSVVMWVQDLNLNPSNLMPRLFQQAQQNGTYPRVEWVRDRRYTSYSGNDCIRAQISKTNYDFPFAFHGQSFGVGQPLGWSTENGWHHVAFVFDAEAEEILVYSEGVLEGVAPSGSVVIALEGFPTAIGNAPSPPNAGWDGKIDDVLIYHRAISQMEVQELFELSPCSFGPTGQPLTFIREKGRPQSEHVSWESCGGTGALTATINHVSSAWVVLNNEIILAPDDFNNNITSIVMSVDLPSGQNTIEVELRGGPGGELSLELE